MSQIVESIVEHLRSGDYAALADLIPYNQFMGIGVRTEGDQLLGVMRYDDELIGNPALPALHGGCIAALLESTAVFELLWRHESIVLPRTVSITVQYLRSGRPLDTFARGVITKHGRRVIHVRSEAWQEEPDRPIAIANAHFLVTPQ